MPEALLEKLSVENCIFQYFFHFLGIQQFFHSGNWYFLLACEHERIVSDAYSHINPKILAYFIRISSGYCIIHPSTEWIMENNIVPFFGISIAFYHYLSVCWNFIMHLLFHVRYYAPCSFHVQIILSH